jgi:hypothetical protein
VNLFKHGIISILLVLFIVGCSQGNAESQKVDIAKLYLEDKGYNVIEHESSVEPFILTQEGLSEIHQMQIWQVQTNDVEDFIGKKIYGEIFVIQNHPLDKYESGTTKGIGKTQVYLMIVDDEIIGGTSFPITEEPLHGALYSLDGKTFEELYPNENWREWADRWIEKYSN